MCVDEGQSTIGSNRGDAELLEALGHCLGGGNFSIARKPLIRSEIGIAIKLIGIGGLLRAGNFDIAEDKDSFAGGELDVDSWIADGEADFVKEGEVRLRDAGKDYCMLFIAHG